MADNFNLRTFLTENKLTKNTQLLKEEEDLEEADWRNNPYTAHNFDGVAKQAQQSKELQAVANRMFPEFGGELENLGTPLTPDQRNAVWTTWSKEKVAREKAERETMQETKLTIKERRLVEMVQRALGLEGVNYGSIEIDGVDSDDYPDFVDAYVISAEFEDGTPLSEEELDQLTDELYQSGELGDMAAETLYEGNKKPIMKETKLTIKERRLVEMVNEALNKDIKAFGQDLDKNFKAAGFDTLAIMQDPTPEQLNIIKTNEKAALFQVLQNNEAQTLTLHVNPKQVGKAKSIVDKFQLSNYDGPVLGKGWTAKQVKGAINPGDIVKQDLNASRGIWYFYRLAKVDTKVVDVNESRLTAKERRLVEMVNRALDTEGYGDDNVNLQREKQGLPPAQGPKYSEAVKENEMTPGEYQDKGMPFKEETKLKYNSIEELMKDIEHGTNEAAHKYKMDEMKRVYEALEAKVGSLEEGEHAEHIDQKAVKQMRKDIAALRKAEEKLRKEFDKKFAGKEKKEAPKAEKVEALQENKNTMENFDLKKFLTENKLTTNSRMLSEAVIDFTDKEQYIDFLQNKTGELEGKKVKLNIFDTFANGDTEKQKYTGDIIVNLGKRTGGTGNLKFDATLIDNGGYNYIAPLKGKKMSIEIPSTTGGTGLFMDEIGSLDGIRGLFKVKTLEILG